MATNERKTDHLQPLTPEQKMRRQEAVRQGNASLRLEGLTPSNEERALQQQWVRGAITSEEWHATILARHGLSDETASTVQQPEEEQSAEQ